MGIHSNRGELIEEITPSYGPVKASSPPTQSIQVSGCVSVILSNRHERKVRLRGHNSPASNLGSVWFRFSLATRLRIPLTRAPHHRGHPRHGSTSTVQLPVDSLLLEQCSEPTCDLSKHGHGPSLVTKGDYWIDFCRATRGNERGYEPE